LNFENLVLELQKPEVFGTKHIVGTLVVALLIAIILIYLLKVKKDTNHYLVLKASAVFLVSLELIKYTYAALTYDSFPYHFIPMQLCSFSLYLMPLVAFSKEKVSKFFMPISYSIGVLAGLIVLIYPATVLGGDYDWVPLSDNILPVLSFLYHGNMIFFSLYLVMSKLYRPSFVDYGKVFIALMVFASFAAVTNLIFDTDMMFLNTANGSPFQFLLVEHGRIVYLFAMIFLAGFLLTLPVLPYITTIKEVFVKRQSVKD